MNAPFLQGPLTASEVAREANNGINHLLARARAYAQLDQRVRAHLPSDCAEHCRIACVRDETLVIIADSAAWATRARLLSDQWLAAVRQYWPGSIRQVAFRVHMPGPQPVADNGPRELPDAVRDHLGHCAASQSDPEMAAILKRMASRKTDPKT